MDSAWGEARGDIGRGMRTISAGGNQQNVIADHQAHEGLIEQRTQDNNIRNDVKHQVDNMVTAYRSDIRNTQTKIKGEEDTVNQQYSSLKNNHKEEEINQNNKYNKEKASQEQLPGADSPDELLEKAKKYQNEGKS